MRRTALLQDSLLLMAVGLGALITNVSHAAAASFAQTDLVSDIPGLAAITDPSLKNSWGISRSATSPFWVSDQATGLATLYSVTGAGVTKVGLTVTIPATGSGPQGPTGQVNNSTTSFVVGSAPANFIFANLNGTISAWNGGLGTTAQIEATTSGAVYTGLALDPSSKQLYAADDAHGRIDVFNASFAPVSLGASAFVDPVLPGGLVPFNIQDIGGTIYVTYAPAGRPAQTSATEGMGAVATFDTNGNFISQLVNGSKLASPWGLALAPASFGAFGGDLLVGNFSYAASEINAFDPMTGTFEGMIPIDVGGNSPGGLWGLVFGNGGSGGDPNTLYFADGINSEADGLFGAIAPVAVPEPSSLLMLMPVLGFLAFYRRAKAPDNT